jgi:hypothetical protein
MAAKQLLSEVAAELSRLDEPVLSLAYATLAAMRQDPDGAELRALVLAVDAAPLTDWLREHGWLATDPVLKLGPVARYAMARSNADAAATQATVEKEFGWVLDMFLPDREKPKRLA